MELGHTTSISAETWPAYDERLIKSDTVTMAVQINGKSRATIELAADADEATAKQTALESESVQKFVAGKDVKKVIYVRGRIINLIV